MMALVVVVVGGVVIAIIFDIMFSHAWISSQQKGSYVDHTTLLSFVQAMKGRIISDNVTAGKTKHAPALGYDTNTVPGNGSLTLADLRFGPPGFPTWHVDDKNVKSGVGVQEVLVEVYDMFFDLDWVKQSALEDINFFPSVFVMKGTESGGGGGGSSGTGSVGGNIEGEAITNTGGTHGSASAGSINPSNYGAYLIRASLFDRGKTSPIRVVEEAFVQILPPGGP